jgi:hypothetical protein
LKTAFFANDWGVGVSLCLILPLLAPADYGHSL